MREVVVGLGDRISSRGFFYVRVTRRRCYGVRVPEIGKVGEG